MCTCMCNLVPMLYSGKKKIIRQLLSPGLSSLAASSKPWSTVGPLWHLYLNLPSALDSKPSKNEPDLTPSIPVELRS